MAPNNFGVTYDERRSKTKITRVNKQLYYLYKRNSLYHPGPTIEDKGRNFL